VVTRTFIILVFCVLAKVSWAQNAKHFYKIAEEYFYGENITDALYYYTEASKKSANYSDVKYRIEICQLLTGRRDKSLEKILAYRDSYGKQDKFYYYFLGKILDYRYQFEDAIIAWNQFLKLDAYKSKEIIAETNLFIAEAQRKKEFISTYSGYLTSHMEGEINSTSPQFSPIFISDLNELLYLSLDKEESSTIYQLKKQNEDWGTPESFEITKSFEFDTDNFDLANHGGELILHQGKSFWSSNRSGETWGPLQEWDGKLGKLKVIYHFHLSDDGNRIIYSSDEDFKKSGLDLFEIVKDNEGKWSKPSPLSDAINTELDERNVFMTEDGQTLYFSSTGHNSIGGFDVFRSQYNPKNKSWSKPENMGYPINTPDNEIDFFIAEGGEFGFLSSDRGKDKFDYDIHSFYRIKHLKLDGTIFDLATKNELSDVKIELVPENQYYKKFEVNSDASGAYAVELFAGTGYNVTISEGDETLLTDYIDVSSIRTDSSLTKDFYLDLFNPPTQQEEPVQSDSAEVEFKKPVAVSVPTPSEKATLNQISKDDPSRYKQYEKPATELSKLGSKYRLAQKAILENIYFDFGTAQLKRESYTVLDELLFTMNYYPDLSIVISGHTDNVGPSDANQWLSENRAKAVKNFLVEMEISEDRIKTVGMGDSEPIASNKKERNGRELNRRIEVLVNE